MPKHGIPKQKKMRGMNQHQKKAHRRGEDRLRGNEGRILSLSRLLFQPG